MAALSVAGTEIAPAEELADGLFAQTEWEIIRGLSPLPAVPPEPTNR